MSIEAYRQIIEGLFAELDIANQWGRLSAKLHTVCSFNPSKAIVSSLSKDTTVSFVEMASVSENGYISKMEPRTLGDVLKGSYTYFSEGDIIIAKITPCMENGKCAVAKGLTNGIGFGSSEFHVIHCSDDIRTKFLFGYLNRESIRRKAASVMTGASGHRRVPISFYENIEIPKLTLKEQDEMIAKMEAIETQIHEAEERLEALTGKTADILNQYLN